MEDVMFSALLPYLSPMRELGRAMMMRGLRRVHDGEAEKALAELNKRRAELTVIRDATRS